MRLTATQIKSINAENCLRIPIYDHDLDSSIRFCSVHVETSALAETSKEGERQRPRIAVIQGDPIDVALDWSRQSALQGDRLDLPIPALCMANEKTPGGQWRDAKFAPEECLFRRSNLSRVFQKPEYLGDPTNIYPLAAKAGIYIRSVSTFDSSAL